MPAQPIKYASTTIEPTQSAGEIAALVRRYGGSRFEMRWGGFGQLEGIRFAICDDLLGEVPVRLEAQTDRIEEILREARPYSTRQRKTHREYEAELREQAYRIAWRQLRDFVEQALLAVETGLFPIGAAFMANLEMWDEASGETVTMGELLTRRAVLESGERGLRLMTAAEAPTVRRLRAGE